VVLSSSTTIFPADQDASARSSRYTDRRPSQAANTVNHPLNIQSINLSAQIPEKRNLPATLSKVANIPPTHTQTDTKKKKKREGEVENAAGMSLQPQVTGEGA